MTNVEKIVNIMEHSKRGVIAQFVVLKALQDYVNAVDEMGLEKVRESFGENHFINPDAWFDACVEIKEKLDKRGES